MHAHAHPTLLKKLFGIIAAFNIDVILIYASISAILIFTYKLIPSHAFPLALANIGFIIASYTLNIIADHAEDSVNGRAPVSLSKPGITVVSTLLFAVFITTYTIKGGIPFFMLSCAMSAASVWYSFPPVYRLKNIFLVKNAVPSLCWALTLASLVFLSGGMYYYTFTQICVGFIPFFTLFFAFEIMWDLPDQKGDSHSGVRTLPTMIGFPAARFTVCLLFLAVLLSIPTTLDKAAVAILIAFVLFVPQTSHKVVYHTFLTGLMISTWIGYIVVMPHLS